MSGELTECVEHEWHFKPGDWCPVCQGIELGKERIIKLLNDLPTQVDYKDGMTESVSYSPDYLIELIKGETK